VGFRITNKGGYDQTNETKVVRLCVTTKDEKKILKCIRISPSMLLPFSSFSRWWDLEIHG
jgi:hypothetical protein